MKVFQKLFRTHPLSLSSKHPLLSHSPLPSKPGPCRFVLNTPLSLPLSPPLSPFTYVSPSPSLSPLSLSPAAAMARRGKPMKTVHAFGYYAGAGMFGLYAGVSSYQSTVSRPCGSLLRALSAASVWRPCRFSARPRHLISSALLRPPIVCLCPVHSPVASLPPPPLPPSPSASTC